MQRKYIYSQRARADKRCWFIKITTEAQNAADSRNTNEMYRIFEKLFNPGNQLESLLRNKAGGLARKLWYHSNYIIGVIQGCLLFLDVLVWVMRKVNSEHRFQ